MNDCKFSTIIDEITAGIPKYRRIIFKAIITILLIGEGGKCISGIYRFFEISMISSIITRRRFYEFLGSKIPFNKIWEIIFNMLGDRKITDGRVLLSLDDTSYGKSGKKIAGCDVHYDHAAKINAAKYIFGHCRVLLGINIFIHNRWACLPIRQGLYRNKKSIDSKGFKTKIEMAAEMILNVAGKITGPILLMCDSWFGNKSLVKKLGKKISKRIKILTRLRKNCVLYDFPATTTEKKRGRKPKYGPKLPKISVLAEKAKREKDVFFIYGKKRECEYTTFNCMTKGFACIVKIVIVYNNGKIFPILSTDLNLTVKEMVEYYSSRWKIESGFKELKHEVGAIDNHARKKNSVENHFELTCVATTTAWIYADKQKEPPKRKFKTARSNTYAFSDIRRKIRNEYYEDLNFGGICLKSSKYIRKFILSLLFQASG